jgi:hypothetical protein
MRMGGRLFADVLKGICVSLAATMAFAGAARAADAQAQPLHGPPPNCFDSFYDFFNSSPADCPLSYAGFTLYATIDAGVGFETNGAPFNGSFGPADAYLISKATNGSRWLLSPNALSSSVLGLKMSEPLGGGWSLIGDVEFGFDPYSLGTLQQPALTGSEQWPAASCSELQRRLEPRRPDRQFARVSRPQQRDLRHLDLWPGQHSDP